MSEKAQGILDEIRALPIRDQHAVWQELEQSLGRVPAPASNLLHEKRKP
jgi:hypothetical protein